MPTNCPSSGIGSGSCKRSSAGARCSPDRQANLRRCVTQANAGHFVDQLEERFLECIFRCQFDGCLMRRWQVVQQVRRNADFPQCVHRIGFVEMSKSIVVCESPQKNEGVLFRQDHISRHMEPLPQVRSTPVRWFVGHLDGRRTRSPPSPPAPERPRSLESSLAERCAPQKRRTGARRISERHPLASKREDRRDARQACLTKLWIVRAAPGRGTATPEDFPM